MLSRLWNKQRPKNLIGLDINAESIKLMLLDTTTTPYTIKYFAQAQLPPDAIIKDEIKNPAVIVPILKELIQNVPTIYHWIAFAIPRSSAIIKNISIDSRLNESEKEARAWVEANRFYPDLVQEIYLDFNVIGPSVSDPKLLDMILVGCRKDQVKPYIELLNEAGMVPKLIDINCYALERAVNLAIKTDPTIETTALLNFDTTLSSLVVIHQKNLIYAHDHSFDGQHLITQIRKQLVLAKTEMNFSQVALTPEEEVIYLKLLKDNLSTHLRHAFHFFYTNRPQIMIQKLFLAGNLASIPLLTKFIKNEVNIETEVFNPLNFLQVDPIQDQKLLQQNPASSTLCLGMALSHLKDLKVSA